MKKDPTKALLYGIHEEAVEGAQQHVEKLTKRQIAVLLCLLISLGVIVYGSSQLAWGMGEIAALFFVLCLVVGIAMGYTPNKISKEFVAGVKTIIGGAIVIGFARAIQIVLTDGMIIDTVVYALTGAVAILPGFLRAAGMYIAQIIINLFIVSSSGQAAAVMPIMIPVADLVGISRQTAVLAFQLGDGFTNYIYPTCAALFVNLSAAKVPYGKWCKFYAPLLGIWTVIGLVAVVIATVIGY